MNQWIDKSKAIKYVIWGILLCVFLMIWPIGLIHPVLESKSDEVVLEESGPINVETNGTQMFLAQGKKLEAIDLYVANTPYNEIMTFRVYDSGYNQLWERFIVLQEKEYNLPGFVRVEIDLEVEEGWAYYYTVEGLSADLYLNLEDNNTSTSFANGNMSYGGNEMEGINIIARYRYESSFPIWAIVSMFLLVVALGYGVHKWMDKWYPIFFTEKKIKVQTMIQWIGNPILVISCIRLLYLVFPGRAFGTGVVNYLVYYVGILLGFTTLWIGLNYKRVQEVKISIPHFLQSVAFAGIVWSCFEYMNGLYEIHHSYGICKIISWSAVFVICTYSKKELLRIWNLIYIIVVPIFVYFYKKPFIGEVELEKLSQLQGYVIFFAGFVILNTMIHIVEVVRKKRVVYGTFYAPFAIATGGIFLLFVLFRNTRDWPVIMVILFVLFYFRMWIYEKRGMILPVICNGILFNFLFAVCYSWMHRPYLKYIYYRYQMMYHTVTMTGVYLTLVIAAIVVKLFLRYKTCTKWQELWKEFSLLGLALSFLFMTMSRTGYFAVIGMVIFLILFIAMCEKQKKLLGITKRIVLVVSSFILFFFTTFTATRIIPAIVNDPIYSEVELTGYEIKKYDATDHPNYMDFNRFIYASKEKLFADATEELKLLDAKELFLVSVGELNTVPDLGNENDFTNGRIDIFKEYIANWNMFGHDKMGVESSWGETLVHAHNAFLQVIHDHGLITGVVFILFGIIALVVSCIRYKKYKKCYYLLTIAIIVGFTVSGMTEWTFHIANPMGFTLLTVITPLLFKESEKYEENLEL
ncbi:MAG: hypothetical protein ACRC7V_07190 [Lachnospiraceae bacterium]